MHEFGFRVLFSARSLKGNSEGVAGMGKLIQAGGILFGEGFERWLELGVLVMRLDC